MECRLSTGVRIVYSDYGKVKLDNDSLKGDTNEMTFSFSQTRKRDFLKIDGWFQYQSNFVKDAGEVNLGESKELHGGFNIIRE